MLQFIGGLRAGMGTAVLKTSQLTGNGRFVRITSGINESPHNVTITKESPNYSR
jgi:IMP dehydrogenase